MTRRVKTLIRLGIRSVSPSDQSPHGETLGLYLPIAKFLREISWSFSANFCRVSTWNFAEKSLSKIRDFYFSSRKKLFRARGVLRWNANKELFFRGKGRKLLGDKLLMSTESPYHFDHLLQVSNKSLWILILYTFFNIYPHVYSPVAGADNPLWIYFSDVKRKALSLCHFCCKFKKIIFEVFILYIFLPVFIHTYSPGAGADNPLGSEFLF